MSRRRTPPSSRRGMPSLYRLPLDRPWTRAPRTLERPRAPLWEKENPSGCMRKRSQSFTRRCRRGYYIIRLHPDRGSAPLVNVRRQKDASRRSSIPQAFLAASSGAHAPRPRERCSPKESPSPLAQTPRRGVPTARSLDKFTQTSPGVHFSPPHGYAGPLGSRPRNTPPPPCHPLAACTLRPIPPDSQQR